MSTATKLTYLNDTKTLLRNGINALGGGLTTDDTFRSYVNALDNIYDYLPKVTGTGTSVTLVGVRDGGLRITLNPTAISQDGTPTPDTPQDIHIISGNNSVVVEGKNLFNGEIELGGLDNSTGGTTNNNNSLRTKNYISILPNTTYTISNNKNYHIRVYFYGASYNFISLDSTIYEGTATFTTDSNTRYIKFRTNSGTTENDLTSLWQLEKSNQATTYTPYVSQTNPIDLTPYNLGSIGNYENRIFKNIPSDTDYSSEREEGGWYYKEGIGKVVLDGTENNWQERTNSGGRKQFYTPTTATSVAPLNSSTQLCNYGKYSSSVYNWGYVGDFALLDNTKVFYLVVDTNAVLNDFKTTIGSNNINVYYPYATPTYTKLTDTTLINQLENIYKNMLSYKGTTNISQVNNDLAFTLSVSALEDLS